MEYKEAKGIVKGLENLGQALVNATGIKARLAMLHEGCKKAHANAPCRAPFSFTQVFELNAPVCGPFGTAGLVIAKTTSIHLKETIYQVRYRDPTGAFAETWFDGSQLSPGCAE